MKCLISNHCLELVLSENYLQFLPESYTLDTSMYIISWKPISHISGHCSRRYFDLYGSI
jgi:hypothetical protein